MKEDSYDNSDIIKAYDRGELAGFKRGIKEGKDMAYGYVFEMLKSNGFDFKVKNEKSN